MLHTRHLEVLYVVSFFLNSRSPGFTSPVLFFFTFLREHVFFFSSESLLPLPRERHCLVWNFKDNEPDTQLQPFLAARFDGTFCFLNQGCVPMNTLSSAIFVPMIYGILSPKTILMNFWTFRLIIIIAIFIFYPILIKRFNLRVNSSFNWILKCQNFFQQVCFPL